MYLTPGRTYYAGGDQMRARGPYLLLATKERDDQNTFPYLYAAVRSVALRQLGHFMMGTARIGGVSISVSGSYGSDGLPLSGHHTAGLTDDLISRYFAPVPANLQNDYWKGGPATEAEVARDLRTWATAWLTNYQQESKS